MSTHKSRMSSIGRVAIPPKGSPARENLEKVFAHYDNDPETQKKIKSLWEQAKAFLTAQQENGAGFELDQTLRYFISEYSNRVIKWDLHSLPASFNVMEAYLSYSYTHAIFQLQKEKDHIFYLDHFLEWVTEPDFPLSVEDVIDCFEPEVIYNYTNAAPLGRTMFSIQGSKSFAVAGFSIVRHGTELTIMLLAGEQTDLGAKTEELQKFENISPFPGKEEIVPGEEFIRKAEPLKGSTDYWKVLAITRFDLSDRTQQVRYILTDCGDIFDLLTDDPDCFLNTNGNLIDPKYESALHNSCKKIVEYESLFEICATSIYLHAYFDCFAEDIVEERHKTDLADKINLLSFRNTNKLIPPSERIAYRKVSTLRTLVNTTSSKITSYSPPSFKIESSGYWKRLAIDEIGADKHGNEIHGRTWVHRKLSWVQSDRSIAPVRATSATECISDGADPGYIYVMRSAVHPKDVFKVGLTRRSGEKRSDELSRETGAPDRFFVMQEWSVSDCTRAESIIHSRLEYCRLNPKREFFEINYKELFAVIDEVIKEVNGVGA